MKKKEQPIPLRSIIILPRWMMISGVVVASACMLAGLAMIVYAIGWTPAGQRGGLIGGSVGCLGGGGGALFGTLCDWSRRLPATCYLRHIKNDQISPMYRKAFWPAVVAFVLGLITGCFIWNNPVIWYGVVQTSGILLFISGSMEAMRRHTTQQARAVFALYADGALGPEDTAAIDDARQKDPKFDADVQAYIAVSDQVNAFAAGT